MLQDFGILYKSASREYLEILFKNWKSANSETDDEQEGDMMKGILLLPKFDTIVDMEDVVDQQLDNSQSQYSDNIFNMYNNWIRLIKDMEAESNVEELVDNKKWDNIISPSLNYEYQINWSSLPPNYQTMTQIYRRMLYFQKQYNMLKNMEEDDYFYSYTEEIIYIPKIELMNIDDIVIRSINQVREYFIQMYKDFTTLKSGVDNYNNAKNLYDKWLTFIVQNLRDTSYMGYKSGSEKYLKILFWDWIYANFKSETPPDLPISVASQKHQQEEDDDLERQPDRRRPRRNND
jgi:hypothetical protein